MRAFQRGSQLLAAALRTPRAPRAQLKSQPPEHPLSAAEQTIAFAIMFTSFMLPTGWVLANLHHYKSRPE
ncbi:Cytochrome c oxidase subunit 8B, mitochondrial [Willisornis vidua]|uniref:Cytochrome c oxidase subunit 8B, mitochondrial n=1 Tax=Willisornis vidua TaxID=1566151 RepID=A0ABQ9DFS5_9PASS|nr:Cytochrome c oxidase subunit 8B, mitochondrial [Willisornis vidua]